MTWVPKNRKIFAGKKALKMIIKLKHIKKEDINIVGSKAANLGDLHQKGFNVPNGFAVTTKAYNRFLESNNLKGKIASVLQGLNIENTEILEKVSQEVKYMFAASLLNGELKKKIDQLLTEFISRHFAVRSSAVNEDLPGASFAGQMDTYLNVSKEQISAKIKAVFASLFNSRAIYYREVKGFSHNAGTAVIIQEMIPSEFAGVLFTIDPLKRKNLLIEVAAGLGENVVSGYTSPNNYSVNRKGFNIEHIEETEPFDHQMVKPIAWIGMEIEKHFAYPQEIEFAVVNNRIFILQARPLTVSI